MLVNNRLISLRTVGLPASLQTESVDLSDSVTVKLRGRDTRRFDFTSGAWHNILSYMASGMQVYAGILSVDRDISGFTVKYYILLTLPEARRHHFLTVKDQVYTDGDKLDIIKSRVKLLPYIRTDNLKDLFETAPERKDESKWKIRIND
ncbi:MAG: hypothetical protein P9X24_05550 [Candidatus Hatepunaea meridiana]|nr:hypothetical protein [Candidatus Hatepunaea meridiana]